MVRELGRECGREDGRALIREWRRELIREWKRALGRLYEKGAGDNLPPTSAHFCLELTVWFRTQIMKTQYYTAATVDGFIATEDDSLDWLFALGNPTESSYPAFIASVGALAMGAVTYEWVLDHAKELVAETGSPWPYTQAAWIFTHRQLRKFPGADIRFASGDVRAVHEEMRAAAGGKNIWVVGGGELVGQFHDAGLLDEIIVQVGSAILGSGKPVLPRRILPPRLHLTSVQQIGAEFVELRYAVQPRGGDA